MGADEEYTLNALRAHREVVDGLIATHRGRIFNSAGDSVVAEFPSAVEGTLCAVEIQQEIARRNEAVPKDKRLQFRIGLNIGDVMSEGGNLFGDGVNVADRVQKLAQPGGICVARNVHDQLRNKVSFTLEPMGEHQVKNIAQPVAVYRVLVDGMARRPRLLLWLAAMRGYRRAVAVILVIAAGGLAGWYWLGGTPPPSGFPSVAVLPFEDLSDGSAPKHYSEGVSEELITLLSRFPSLSVVARTAPAQPGQDLKADYLLEGSVQKNGDGLRINAWLIDAHANLQVWAEGYDGNDASSLQDEAVGKVIVALASERGEIRRNEYKKTAGKATGDLDEYGYHLRSDEIMGQAETLEEHDRVAAVLQEGLERFPDSALLRVTLARYYFARTQDYEPADPAADYRRAGDLAREALASPNPSPTVQWLGHRIMAYINWTRGDFVRAVADAEAAVALAPYDANTLSRMARIQIASGNVSRGIEWVQESIRRDPTIPRNTRILAWAYYLSGDYEESIEAVHRHEQLSRIFAEDAYWYMAASYVRLGRLEEARAAVKKLLQMRPYWTQAVAREFHTTQPYKDPSLWERELADLSAAGLPAK
jgi:TolB-like protein